MSTDINLLLERRAGRAWAPALDLADRVGDPRTHLGILNVCWWSVRSDATSLFFGDHAVFPFHAGLPTDLSPRVFEFVRANFEADPTFAAWISLADLDLASWPRRTVIVGGPVPVCHAPLFGDGRQPPPTTQLRALGIEDPVLERITDWRNTRKYEYQSLRTGETHQPTPDSVMEVTWIETLDRFADRLWREGLSGLVGLASPECYRIVTKIG